MGAAMRIDRRKALGLLGAGAATPAAARPAAAKTAPVSAAQFEHGVASGDPLAGRAQRAGGVSAQTLAKAITDLLSGNPLTAPRSAL
jgi:hypothetical protein